MAPLTKIQTLSYWRLWKAACDAQGWTRERGLKTADIDAKRRRCLAECGVESMKDLDSGTGFTNWKNLCLRLTGDLNAAVAEVRRPRTKADRLRWVIINRILPCLAVYAPNGCEDARIWSENYLGTILRFTLPGHGFPGESEDWTEHLEDLTESELTRVLATLNACVATKRKQDRHSIHDMHIRAKIPCPCAACKKITVSARPTSPF